MGSQQDANRAIEKAMRENPCGMVVSIGKKTCSAVFWTDAPASSNEIMLGNFLSGFAQQGIDRGHWTKKDAILALETVLTDRK